MHRALEELGWGFLMLERGVVEVKVIIKSTCVCLVVLPMFLSFILLVLWVGLQSLSVAYLVNKIHPFCMAQLLYITVHKLYYMYMSFSDYICIFYSLLSTM